LEWVPGDVAVRWKDEEGVSVGNGKRDDRKEGRSTGEREERERERTHRTVDPVNPFAFFLLSLKLTALGSLYSPLLPFING
jgi:hypothetical protein